MSAWDEQPEHQNEIADLETARLALRGAIQSVRSLQDLNGKLKDEIRDFLHREKALNERLIRLQAELNDSYARLDQETAHDREREAAVRETLRQEIVAEQNHKWQSGDRRLAAIRAKLDGSAAAKRNRTENAERNPAQQRSRKSSRCKKKKSRRKKTPTAKF